MKCCKWEFADTDGIQAVAEHDGRRQTERIDQADDKGVWTMSGNLLRQLLDATGLPECRTQPAWPERLVRGTVELSGEQFVFQPGLESTEADLGNDDIGTTQSNGEIGRTIDKNGRRLESHAPVGCDCGKRLPVPAKQEDLGSYLA